MRAVLALVLLAASIPVQAQDLYSLINRLRQSVCSTSADLAPLRVDRRLEQAAAALARAGSRDLSGAVKGAGYRATRSTFIGFSGDPREEDLMALLQRSHCARLADPEFADAGIYRGGGQSFIVLAAPFSPRVAETQEEAGRKVLALVNEARRVPRSCGPAPFQAAGPLKWNDALARAALMHAGDMASSNYFSHEAPDGSNPADRVTRVGYRYRTTGENIAAGPVRAEEVVAGWIKSPGHCANLMSPDYTEMGAAYAANVASDMGVYWAQEFGTQR